MLDRILDMFGYRSSGKNSGSSTQQPELKVDCFECRMIGGTGLTGLGAYIIYYSFQKRNQPTTGRLTMFASSFVGSVIMTMGMLRLAGIHDLPAPQQQPNAVVKPKQSQDGELLKE